MAFGRLLLFPYTFVLLLYLHNFLALVAEQKARDGISEGGSIRITTDSPGTRNVLQVEGFTSPIAVDSTKAADSHSPSFPLNFDPPSLDFREQNVGMPELKVVKIANPSNTQPLQLTSISGDSPDFHPSFFKSKVVKPGDWTTFDVVFLARMVGAVQNTLYIHTSLGTFDYKVQGIGTPNPFRLRSLLGARIPLNATYSPLVTMYNPFNRTLQVTEMYSSGGELQLELLTGQTQGSRSLWEIRPYDTKTIAKANFFGKLATNYTSFIRIKTDHPSSPSLVIPVEVEVSESSSLFLSRELLDFGILKSGESKTVPIFILNSGVHQVHIRSISVVPENPALEIEYTTTSLKPGIKYTKIASVSLNVVDQVTLTGQQSGMVVIQMEDTSIHRLEVPYEAFIMQGSLSYDKSHILFRVGKPPFHPVIRNFSLSNQFKVPVVLYDVRLPSKAQEYFHVFDFESPYVIPPSSEWHQPFSVQFIAQSSDCLYSTTLRLSTNSSLFNIPLHCYDGRVAYSLENHDEDVLDFGILSDADVLSKSFTIYNENPVREGTSANVLDLAEEVGETFQACYTAQKSNCLDFIKKIAIISFHMSDTLQPDTTIELVAIQLGNNTKPSAAAWKKSTPPVYVDPGYEAVFQVNVSHPQKLGTFTGEITVHTSFDRTLHVPVYYKTAVGSIKLLPEKIIFEPTFPYGTSRLPLLARNFYPQALKVTSVRPEPEDPRFYLVNERLGRLPYLRPNSLVEVGTLVFDPLLGDSGEENVYVGDPSFEERGSSSEGKPRDPGDDVRGFEGLWRVWSSLVDQGLTFFNFSLILNTELGTDWSTQAEASLHWPRLSPRPRLDFPPTTVGNSSIQILELSNPSTLPVFVQLLMLHQYSRPLAIIDVLATRLQPELNTMDFTKSTTSFSLQTDSKSSASSPPALLPPHSEPHHLTVAFTPRADQPANGLLLIRNNLTVLDFVVLRGRGILGVFTIDGIQPGADPLLFEFPSSPLEKCQSHISEPLRLTKSFRMHNSGIKPLTVSGVRVGGGSVGCEEHGFSVPNCDAQITIMPNRTRNIDIVFIPDFTQSRVSNTLRVQMLDGTEMLFPLLATLPHHMLAACYMALPRPEWEKQLAWLAVPMWLTLLVVLVLAVFLRTNLGMKSRHSYQASKGELQSTGGTVFNLADITKSVQAALAYRIAALKQSVQHPETLKPSRHWNTSKLTSGTEFHKPYKDVPKPTTTQYGRVNLQQQPQHLQMQHHSDVRHRSPPTKQQGSPSISSVHQGLHSTIGVTKAASSGNASLKTVTLSSLGIGASKSTASSLASSSECLPPTSPTTDNDTGMRKFPVDSTEQTSIEIKPEKLLKSSSKVVTESAASLPTASTDSSGGVALTPTTTRKVKGIRKPGMKAQKSPHAPEPLSVVQTTAVVVQTDHLERKESESSFKSTDSEQSSSSSIDKSEDKDEVVAPSSPAVVETEELLLKPKASPPSMAKEPGTGQTIHITDTPEDQTVKGEASAEVTAVQAKKGKELPTASAVTKVKSKKKLKQQQKREEKLRRREREREREKERERQKEKEREREHKAQLPPVDKHNGSSESNDKDSTSSFEEECSEQAAEDQKIESSSKPGVDARGVEVDFEQADGKGEKHLEVSESLVEEEMIEESPEPEMEPVETILDHDDAIAQPDASDDRPPLLQSPVDSVPSTAIRTTRVRSSKHQKVDEVIVDPFSRTPDRSTYSSKKTSPRKPEKSPDNRTEPIQGDENIAYEETENEYDATSMLSSAKFRPYSLEIIEPSSGDSAEDALTASPESAKVETDGISLANRLTLQKLPLGQPTSPHELAASLLSSKLRKQPLRNSEKDGIDPEEEDNDEEIKQSMYRNEDQPSPESSPSKYIHARPQDYDRSPQKVPIRMGRYSSRQHAPTTLSLDAQPFQPSPDFHRMQTRLLERQKYANTLGDYLPPGLNAPPGFAPTPSETAFMGLYPQEKRFRKREHLRPPHPKAPTPSPPYHMSGDGQQFFGDHDSPDTYSYGGDPRLYESVRNDPQLYDVPEDHQALYSLGRRQRDAGSPLDPQLTGHNRLRGYPDSAYLAALQQQHHQHMVARRRAAAAREHHAYGPPSSSLWDQPSAHHLRSQDDEAITQQLRRRYLLDMYYRHQAQRSAEVLSSLNQTYRSSRRGVYAPEINQPSGNLWESTSYDPSTELLPPQRSTSLDDSYLSESMHAHQLRQQQMLQEQAAARHSHHERRRRTYSGESEIGGELVSGLQSGLQSMSYAGPPGLNRAPGSAFFGDTERSRTRQSSSHMEGPSEGAPGSNWSSIWSLDSPFNTSGSKEPSTRDTTSSTSQQQQPYASNTYDLFENQGIWSLGSGDTTSGLLSWAHLKPDEDKNN